MRVPCGRPSCGAMTGTTSGTSCCTTTRRTSGWRSRGSASAGSRRAGALQVRPNPSCSLNITIIAQAHHALAASATQARAACSRATRVFAPQGRDLQLIPVRTRHVCVRTWKRITEPRNKENSRTCIHRRCTLRTSSGLCASVQADRAVRVKTSKKKRLQSAA